jgi:serine kinase of HPr protein (carbohydrate metabolism regulator)
MNINEMIQIIEGKLLTPDVNPQLEIKGGFAGDLMSDVLASIKPESVLITGLTNPQVVRTALIADVRAVIFARGKSLSPETIQLALQEKTPIITSKLGVYEICGRLSSTGLPSFENEMAHAFDQD